MSYSFVVLHKLYSFAISSHVYLQSYGLLPSFLATILSKSRIIRSNVCLPSDYFTFMMSPGFANASPN